MEISTRTVQRLPLYIQYLKSLPADTQHISSTRIARGLGLNNVQVRKDLAAVSSGGRPKIGYVTQSLIADIERFLGCGGGNRIAIVGMGHLGKALAHFSGFQDYGQRIVAVFDADRRIIGGRCMDHEIQPASRIPELCRLLRVDIGVIAVPAASAQEVCGLLVQGGVGAIWNFAPTHLTVPGDVLVHNENMAASLAILSSRIDGAAKAREQKKEEGRNDCGGMPEAQGVQL